jgi:hypothetical protein
VEALEAALLETGAPLPVLEKPFEPDRLLEVAERATDRGSEHTDRFSTAALLDVAALPAAEPDRGEGQETHVFPFAALLQRDLDADEDGRTRLGPVAVSREMRIAGALTAALEDSGLEVSDAVFDACVEACERAVAEELAAEREAPPEPKSEPAVAGSIELLSIDQVLQLASNVGEPARCRFERDGASIEVYYRGAEVVYARQDNLPDGFLLGRMLVAMGKVSQRDVDRCLEAPGGYLGQRLIDRGLISEAALREVLRLQTEELVYEVVRWGTGRFAVFPNQRLPRPAEQARMSVPVQHLLLEGMRRLDDWQRMSVDLGDLAAIPGRLEVAASTLASLSPGERMVLEAVDGRRTVADLLRSVARPSFDVVRTLHELRGRRLLAFPRSA